MKSFDCVEMKRRGAERIRNLLKDLTDEEKLAFWHTKNEETIARYSQRLARGDSAPTTGTRSR